MNCKRTISVRRKDGQGAKVQHFQTSNAKILKTDPTQLK